MGGILECDGVFQVPLGDDWTVRGQPGRSYDLSHASLDVGVNISVYAQAAVGDDVRAAVAMFANSAGADGHALSVVEVPAKDHRRAFARFDVDGRAWLAAFVYLGEAGVLVTANSRVGDEPAFEAGEVVVASLGPVQKRRLFGRK